MKHTKKLLSAVLVLSLLLTSGFFALAARKYKIIDNVESTRIVNIPSIDYSDGITCTCIGGLGIKNKAMYTVKVDDTNTGAILYYYSDYTKVSKEDRKIYYLSEVGHANGMTVDGTYLYITTWSKNNENKIMRIETSLFNTLKTKSTITSSRNEVDILDTYIEENNVPVLYPYKIGAITRHYKDGTFLVTARIKGFNIELTQAEEDAKLEDNDYDFPFTRASIEVVNGKDALVVSNNINHVFFVENNLYYDVRDQDICYSETQGFFIPKSHYENSAKNAIFWANIKGGNNDTTKEVRGVTYRSYTPDIIINDRSEEKGLGGLLRFNVYEVESCALTPDGDLYISNNIRYHSNYWQKHYDLYGEYPATDRIIKLTHDNGQKFTLS